MNIFNPREPQIRQSLFRQMHFFQLFAKVCHRQSFPLYGICTYTVVYKHCDENPSWVGDTCIALIQNNDSEL